MPRPPATPPKPAPEAAAARIAAGLFDGDDATFERWLAAFAAELRPRGALESLLVAQAVQAARRLRRAARTEADAPPGDPAWSRYHALAERGFYRALDALDDRRRADGRDPAPAAVEDEGDEAVPDDDRPLDHWRDHWPERVAVDPAVSPDWPVVRGTAITADSVMQLVDEGLADVDILARLPALARADLHACIACDAAGQCGPRPHQLSPRPPPGPSPPVVPSSRRVGITRSLVPTLRVGTPSATLCVVRFDPSSCRVGTAHRPRSGDGGRCPPYKNSPEREGEDITLPRGGASRRVDRALSPGPLPRFPARGAWQAGGRLVVCRARAARRGPGRAVALGDRGQGPP